MPHNTALQDLERNVFTSRFQDGLMEIFIACVLLVFVLAPFLSPVLGDFWSSAVFLPFWALVALGLALTRRHIVLPRIGTVEHGPWRRARLRRFNALAYLVGSLALVLGVLSAVQFDTIPGWTHAARFSLVILIGFGLTAYLLGLQRLYLYGALIALAPMVGELLHQHLGARHHGIPVAFGAVAATLLLVGFGLLMRLIHRHPESGESYGPWQRPG